MDEELHIALRTAVDAKRVDILKAMLEDAKAKGILTESLSDLYKGKSLLHYANEKRHVDIVRTLLVSFNADPSVKSDNELSCYQSSAEDMQLADVYHSYFLQLVTNDKLDHVEKCVDAGMDCNQEYPIDKAYLLSWACQYSSEEMVTYLLHHGAKVDLIDSDGLTALHVAFKSLNEGAIRALMKHSVKSDITIKSPFGDYQGYTSLDLCRRLCPQFEKYLYENLKDESTETSNSDEHAMSPDSVNLNAEAENATIDTIAAKGKLSLCNSLSKDEDEQPSLAPNGAGNVLHAVQEDEPREISRSEEKLKSLISVTRKRNNSANDSQLCPIPKVVNMLELAPESNEVSKLSSFKEILVSMHNFPQWQIILDLVTVMLNPLSRMGLKLNISMHTERSSAKVQAYQIPLYINYVNSDSVTCPGKYILRLKNGKCFIKCYSIEGARNGLATFVQLMSAREPFASPCVIYDSPLMEARSVMFDFNMWLGWKTGIIYEVLLISSLLKYNQIVIPISTYLSTLFHGSVEGICQKLVEVVILAERFCLKVVPYVELSSLNVEVPEAYQKELAFFKQMLSCFNHKQAVIFGPKFTTFLCQNSELCDYTLLNLRLNGDSQEMVFCVDAVSEVSLVDEMFSDVAVCCTKPDVLKECLEQGARVLLKAEEGSSSRGLVARAQMSNLLSSVEQSSFCEGCMSVCSFASESVPLFVTCLPQLLGNAEFSWNASLGSQSGSSGQTNFYGIVDKLIYNQAPGFANALSVLSHVEFTLMSSTGEEESDWDVYPGVVCSSTPILKWLQDPGVLSVEKTDPVSIAQAEKDLRSIFAFIEVHLQPSQIGTAPNGSVTFTASQKLAYQTQAFMFQLRACANLALFSVKLLKSLYFAGRNPAAQQVKSGDATPTSPTSRNQPDRLLMNGASLESVNLGVQSLSRQAKTDLANRLIVAMNDLKVIAKQELDDYAFACYDQKAFVNILDQFIQSSNAPQK